MASSIGLGHQDDDDCSGQPWKHHQGPLIALWLGNIGTKAATAWLRWSSKIEAEGGDGGDVAAWYCEGEMDIR